MESPHSSVFVLVTTDQPLESEPGSAIYYSFITFTGHNEFQPRTNSARLFAFSLTLWALITASAYTANLASFLVAQNQPDVNFRSLEEAVLVGAPICIQGGVSQDQFVVDKHPSAVLIRKENGREVFMGLKNGDCSVALAPLSEYESFRRNREINGDCRLSSTGRVEKYVPSGLATAVDTGTYCTSLINHVLDYHLIQATADGFFERVLETFLNRVGEQNCVSEAVVAAQESENEDTFSLDLQDMSGIFIVHGIFSSVALLLAVAKYFWVKRLAKKMGKDDAEATDMEENKKPSETTMRVEEDNSFSSPKDNTTSFEEGTRVSL